jgi:hypothetical protein
MTAARTARAVPRVPMLISLTDGLFFLLGGIAAGWVAALTLRQLILGGLGDWWLLLVLWLLLAYLLLPRVHTALALVYVPDYFIGRTRTYEGLLGDPVNVALLGSEAQIHEAMTSAGWRLADELGFRSGIRTIGSTLSRRTYSTAPVSPLFLFGRMQDFTYQQEVEGSPARRHHVRFWRTPDDWFLPGGARVDWLAAGTYDRGIGLSVFTLQVTHKIAKDTDRERDHIVRSVLTGNPDTEESVIRHFSSGYHSRNGGGDAIETDGDLPVLDVSSGADADEGVPDRPHRPTGSLATQARELIEAAKDTAVSNRVQRPMTLYVGYGLMLVRAIVAATTATAGVFGWAGGRSLTLPDSAMPAPVALAVIAVAVVLYIVTGQLTFGGHPVPRVLALTISVAAIVFALLPGPAPSGSLASVLQLLNLVLDIAILITLSSGDVREFQARPRGT